MSTIQISARIPAELKTRIDSLKQPGESLGALLERAVAALEAADDSNRVPSGSNPLADDIAALAARIEALETWRDSMAVASGSKR